MRSEPQNSWRAPGRVNIIGEHIDYLGGTVLPFACGLETVVTRIEGPLTFVSEAGPVDRYARAVAQALQQHGYEVHECGGEIRSAIPIGAGLSSSAALAAGIALALTRGIKPAPRVLQDAEQIASGVPCGVMDQTAVLEGRAAHALLLDCATGSVDHVPIPEQVGFVVIDTGTRRDLSDGRYAQRRAEAEGGDVRRMRHVTSEQRRVFEAVDALRARDVASLGALVSASHASLRDDFEVSSAELDEAVTRAEGHQRCRGARLVGAGFAGCVLAVVEAGYEQDFAELFDVAWPVRAVDGAGPA